MKKLLMLVILLSGAGGCVEKVAPEEFGVENAQPVAFIEESRVWDFNPITVCWVEPKKEDEGDRKMVEHLFWQQVGKKINLGVVGWKPCDIHGGDIRILFGDELPRSKVGKSDEGGPTMWLNNGFKNWGKGCLYSGRSRLACLQYETVHEFAHALGGLHEQNRKDAPYFSTNFYGGTVGCKPDESAAEEQKVGTTYGPYDFDSILNYCAHTIVLSPLDIKALQELYGHGESK